MSEAGTCGAMQAFNESELTSVSEPISWMEGNESRVRGMMKVRKGGKCNKDRKDYSLRDTGYQKAASVERGTVDEEEHCLAVAVKQRSSSS
jgi:hypothetical protein